MRHICAAFTSLVLITGCYAKPKPEMIPYQKPKLEIANPAPLKLERVDLFVLKQGEADKKMKQHKLPVAIGMSSKDFKKFSENMIYIQNYIQQQKNVIEAYRKYYEPGEN